jgi:hypothetical protein
VFWLPMSAWESRNSLKEEVEGMGQGASAEFTVELSWGSGPSYPGPLPLAQYL